MDMERLKDIAKIYGLLPTKELLSVHENEVEKKLLKYLINQCDQPPHVINKSELERLLNERIR